MGLEQIFRSDSVIRQPEADTPEKWREFVDVATVAAIELVFSFLPTAVKSRMAARCREATDLGLIPPSSLRDRRNAKLWKLALAYSETDAIWFNYPGDEFLIHRVFLPPDYLCLVSRLGAMHFGRVSGVLLWPRAIENARSSLTLWAQTQLVPFYSHGTGDFDCWRAEDYSSIVFHDHETGADTQVCSAGLAAWIEVRFAEHRDAE